MQPQRFLEIQDAVDQSILTDEAAANAILTKVNKLKNFSHALHHLRDDWRLWREDEYPILFFFSSIYFPDSDARYFGDHRIMWADELSGHEEGFTTRKSYYSKRNGRYETYRLPPHGPLKSVVRRDCPKCKQSGLLIGKYVNETVTWESGPYPDSCHAFVLCDGCQTAAYIASNIVKWRL